MAIRYYDDAIIYKLKKWIPENSNLRVYRPNETKRLFEQMADDQLDAAFKLPFISLSREDSITLNLNIKNGKSFDSYTLDKNEESTLQWNAIPIKPTYQLDIYTKTVEDGDEYLRNFLFKLINNPLIIIDIPYNGQKLHHVAYIRVLETVSNTSDVSERLFAGQFCRWTIQFEIQDAQLFSVPYKPNWIIDGITVEIMNKTFNEQPIETYNINLTNNKE